MTDKRLLYVTNHEDAFVIYTDEGIVLGKTEYLSASATFDMLRFYIISHLGLPYESLSAKATTISTTT